MNYALLTEGVPQELPRGLPFIVGEVQHPANVLDIWTADELASIGVYQIVEPQVPTGHRVIETSLAFVDGSVVRQAVTEPFTPPPEPVPQAVSAARAKITLFEDGLYDTVEAICTAHPYFPVRIWWASATEWQRHHPYILAIGAELGLTEEDLDDKFVRAAAK